jgi:hypothetical protein
MSEGLSPRVRAFILAHVDSIELLEVLLMLAARPDASLSVQEISDQLRTAPQSAAIRLRHLVQHDLVLAEPPDRFRIRQDPELAAIVREVAQTYRERHVTVVTLIYSRPSDVVRVFADAFVIKKGRNDG